MDEQQLFIMIGELKAGQAAQLGAIQDLTASTDSLNEKMNNLPCDKNLSLIKTLMEWKVSCNGFNNAVRLEKVKGGISLRTAVISSILGTGVLTTLIVKFFELIGR